VEQENLRFTLRIDAENNTKLINIKLPEGGLTIKLRGGGTPSQ
jgi:hypothetical protein